MTINYYHIINVNPERQKMDSRLYRHVFGELPKRRTVSHNCIPCYNLAAPDILKHISKNFSLNDETGTVSSRSDVFPFFRDFSYETDFSTVFYPGSGVVDRASKLVSDKMLWEKKLTHLTPKDYNKANNSLKLIKKDKISELNPALEKYLKHFKSDPEPDFTGNYNWLYTGGNISGFNSGSNHYLIAFNEINNSMVLNFTKFDPNVKEMNADGMQQGVFYLEENDPVFQISCNNEVDNLLVVTRQRHRITLARMDDNLGCNCWNHKINYGIFICSDLNSKSRAVAVVDNFLEANIFDIENGQKTLLHKARVQSPSWAQIMFNRDGTGLYFAGQHSLHMIDLRAVTSNASLLYEPLSKASGCDVICNVITRKYDDNTLLVATSHNLFEIDVRNRKVNQRWTHLMTSPPQFGKTSCKDGEEIIILQSENPDEMVGIINESKDSDCQFVSRSNPRVFDNIRREWNRAQLSGICAHPGIRERLDFAVTGLEILEIFADSNDGPHIFTINGGGDVMVNKLKKNTGHTCEGYRDISEETVRGLKAFEDHCVNTYSSEMSADELIDMSPLVKVLAEENSEENNAVRRKAIWPQAEMFSPESLSYYKDYMAERILEVWDVKMRNFWDEDEKDEKDESLYEQFGLSKVVQWMETNEHP